MPNALSQAYTLRFRNRSESQHDFLCYQNNVDVNHPYVYTLAWFAQPVANGVDVDFTWYIDYDFVWSSQGMLEPGITFQAEQVVPAGLIEQNRIGFTRKGGAFQFGNQTSNGSEGSLTIDSDSSIPKFMSKIGIGMSGFGTHVIDGEPNFAAVFTPHPEYWISFGSYQQGEVLDIQSLVYSAQVKFPANVYQVTATLNSGNVWALDQGLQ